MATINKQQVLARVRRKENPHALLGGLQTGAATVKNSTEFPPKFKYTTTFDTAIPLLGMYLKNHETLIGKNIGTPGVYHSIIYSSQDLEKAQVPISRWVDEKAAVHLHNKILLTHKTNK